MSEEQKEEAPASTRKFELGSKRLAGVPRQTRSSPHLHNKSRKTNKRLSSPVSPNPHGRSSFLFGSLKKGNLIHRKIDTEFSGTSELTSVADVGPGGNGFSPNFDKLSLRNKKNLKKFTQVSSGAINLENRFRLPHNVVSPGPKYQQEIDDDTLHYSFGGGPARGQYDTRIIREGEHTVQNNPKVTGDWPGPQNYDPGAVAIKMKESVAPRSVWGMAGKKRFQQLGPFVTPGPKYEVPKSSLRNGIPTIKKQGVNWGPRQDPSMRAEKHRESLRKLRIHKERHKTMQEQLIKKEQHTLKQSRSERNGRPSMWAQRAPSKQYLGEKCVSSSVGLHSPGPVDFVKGDRGGGANIWNTKRVRVSKSVLKGVWR